MLITKRDSEITLEYYLMRLVTNRDVEVFNVFFTSVFSTDDGP